MLKGLNLSNDVRFEKKNMCNGFGNSRKKVLLVNFAFENGKALLIWNKLTFIKTYVSPKCKLHFLYRSTQKRFSH